MTSFWLNTVSQRLPIRQAAQKPLLRFGGASHVPSGSPQQKDTFQSGRPEVPLDTQSAAPEADPALLDRFRGSDSFETLLGRLAQLNAHQLATLRPGRPGGDISSRFDPNRSDKFGDTLLMSAVAGPYKSAELARFLVSIGASVNAQNRFSKGFTPLILAIRDKADDCVDALLEAPDLEVNLPDEDGNTPLAHAVSAENLQVVDRLLRKGANPNLPNQNGLTPLSQACLAQNLSIVKKLLKAQADPDLVDLDGDTPLMLAAITQNIDLVEALLNAEADPNHWNNHGMSPLAIAVNKQNNPLANLLLKYGAQPDALNRWGQTLLTALCQIDAPDAVDFVLSLGADVNQPNFMEYSPLKQAIIHRQPQVVARLLNHPDLAEREPLTQAWQILTGESELSEQACLKLAHHLTAPFFADALRETPELDLMPLFRQFSSESQYLRTQPRLVNFRRRSPDGYAQFCTAYLQDLIQAETSTAQPEPVPASASEPASAPTPEEPPPLISPSSAASIQIPPRLVSGFNMMLRPLNPQRITAKLEHYLSELYQVRPDYWRKIRVDELYQLFRSHQLIRQAELEKPADYLLACKAFLGLTLHYFQQMDDNPALLDSFKPMSFRNAYINFLALTLERQELGSECNHFALLDRLT